jgi:hypothetical protein
MSIFGKILAIFVFLLSLVWFGLTVNLYATRAEWKKAYTDASKAAATNAKDTEELKKQLRLERANIDAREQAANQSVRAVAQQRDGIQAEYDKLKVDQNRIADATAGLTPTLKEYDAGIKKLQKQVDDLTTENAAVTKDRDAYALRAQAAENRATNAELQAKVLQDANAFLTQRVTQLQEARPGVAAAAGGAFRGEVSEVSQTGDTISFSGGLNAGVKEGSVYRVTRDKSPYFVGTVTVTVVGTTSAAGTFTSAKGAATGDYRPKAGDTVESR